MTVTRNCPFASNDGNEWTQIREFTEADNLPTYAGATYRSPVIDLGQDYSHLRILLQASPYRLYLVFAEFNLWRIDENPDYHGPELLEPAEYRYVMQPYGREYRMHVDWLTDLETSSVPRIDINTNNTTPTSASTRYTAPFDIEYGPTYKAKVISIYTDRESIPSAHPSQVVDYTWQIPVAAPYVTYSYDATEDKFYVYLSSTQSGVSFRYTTDGSTEPTATSGTLYASPFEIAAGANVTIKAIAYNTVEGTNYSSTVTTQLLIPIVPTLAHSYADITSQSGSYLLADDFTASGTLGFDGPFMGTLDGQFNEITLSAPLFASLVNATIKNVVVSSASISGTDVGTICGQASGMTRIYNCGILSGTLSGTGCVGSIAGVISGNTRVVNCYSYATVSGGDYAAGIVGRNAEETGTRVALCMMYGDMTEGTNRSPVYGGYHTSNVKNFIEYNYWRSKANLSYTVYNDQQAIISIRDNGIGIPEDKLERIFERFYQSPSSINDRNTGTGIGLDLTRSLVELHHGTIIARNNNGEKGCEFVVTIPLGNSHLKPEEIVLEVPPTIENDNMEEEAEVEVLENKELPKVNKRQKIVVAEDDSEIRDYLKTELSSDYDVICCANGKEGLSAILKHLPDLVISDIMMPEMDGNTLCSKIKSNAATNHIPVILLTAKSREEDQLEGLEMGADSYIVKPFNMDILRRTIINLIHTHQTLQLKFGRNDQLEELVDDIKMKSPDDKLLERVMSVINKNLGNADLNVNIIADEVGISRVHLHRKMKELTGQTPHDFIRNIRMKKAANLLSGGNMNVSEVMYACGFSNAASFSTVFKKMYGMSPRDYMNEHLARGAQE